MDGHPLIKLAYMLYWVCPTIVYGKGWLVEPPRKLSPLYPTREGRLRDAVQCLTHGVICQALVRWAFIRKRFHFEGFLISACIHCPHHY